MKMKKNKWTIQLLLFGLLFTSNCKEKEILIVTPQDPIITWDNPDDIRFGTLLSGLQLNATSNVLGVFVYTPPIGTRLAVGDDLDLKVDFTPNDTKSYNKLSKTVKINVYYIPGTTAIFNPNLQYGSMTDQDGNTYKTITIGTQTWMAENLRTTKYRNGDPIPEILTIAEWTSLTTGGYCNFENIQDNDTIATFGRLYNWFTVADSRNLAPVGWHVPTDADWTKLTTYLGGENIAGGKMKETGITHWEFPNSGATNESGFTALPSGSRDNADGIFYLLGSNNVYWTTTQSTNENAWYRYLKYNGYNCYRGDYNKRDGFSVRCVMD
jgi:uncharacterized protein (TIGR02145 family)